MAKTIVEYTTSENMLIVSTGIEPVGNTRVHVVDDIQQNTYDSKDQLIRAEIMGLHRLPKLEQNRVIAEWEIKAKPAAKRSKSDKK